MLQLEYICTDAEMREAQSLELRETLGKGSRVWTNLALFGMLALALALVYFQLRNEVSPRWRIFYLLLFPAAFVFLHFSKKRARNRPRKPVKIELSDREVMIINDGLRVSTPWTEFGKCLESPNIFILLNKTGRYLLIFPKRVFPDERAQNWFRSQASQPHNVAASTADTPFSASMPVPADGIALNFQLGYWDYFNRLITSWRTRGIALGLYMLITGICLYQGAQPDPDAVNSPAKVYFVFMLPIFTAMLVIIAPVVALISWLNEKKHLTPRQIVLSGERLDFGGPDGSGFIPWTTFKYYKENRWSFYVWNPSPRQWDMFPKRAFTSAMEIERCRALLQKKLLRSRWFYM